MESEKLKREIRSHDIMRSYAELGHEQDPRLGFTEEELDYWMQQNKTVDEQIEYFLSFVGTLKNVEDILETPMSVEFIIKDYEKTKFHEWSQREIEKHGSTGTYSVYYKPVYFGFVARLQFLERPAEPEEHRGEEIVKVHAICYYDPTNRKLMELKQQLPKKRNSRSVKVEPVEDGEPS